MDERIKPVAGCVIDKQRGLCDPFMATTVRDPTVWDEPYIAKLYSQQSIDALRAEVDNLSFQLDAQEIARVRDNAYLIARAERAEAEAEAKQARIDELMLEYCPDEMTPEQVENWKRHQVPAIDAARKGAE